MSTSEKAMRVHEHYGEALAGTQMASSCPAMRPVYGKSFRIGFCPRRGRVISASARTVLVGKIASVVETLKLIIPQQDARRAV